MYAIRSYYAIMCAGRMVIPGDVVVADDDGVVIVERKSAERVVAAARERENREAEKRVRLASGELGLDIYNMRPRLAEKGLVYLENRNNFV